MAKLLIILLFAGPLAALAAPLATPGDPRLRHDLELLNDTGIIDIPLTTWPLALGDLQGAMQSADTEALGEAESAALARVKDYLSWQLEADIVTFRVGLAAAAKPRIGSMV